MSQDRYYKIQQPNFFLKTKLAQRHQIYFVFAACLKANVTLTVSANKAFSLHLIILIKIREFCISEQHIDIYFELESTKWSKI